MRISHSAKLATLKAVAEHKFFQCCYQEMAAFADRCGKQAEGNEMTAFATAAASKPRVTKCRPSQPLRQASRGQEGLRCSLGKQAFGRPEKEKKAAPSSDGELVWFK